MQKQIHLKKQNVMQQERVPIQECSDEVKGKALERTTKGVEKSAFRLGSLSNKLGLSQEDAKKLAYAASTRGVESAFNKAQQAAAAPKETLAQQVARLTAPK